MKMYKIVGYGKNPIEEIEVIKETKFFVTVRVNWNGKTHERNQAKDGKIFPTFEEAKKEMVETAQIEVENARARLEQAKGKLGNVKGIKNPYEAAP